MPGTALIVANGILPRESIVRSLCKNSDFVLAADGGANKLIDLGIIPDAVLGDFDSLTVSLPDSVERIEAPSQDATDLEKAVQYLKSKGFDGLISMTGVTGGRLDHTFGALAVASKYGVWLIDDIGTGIALNSSCEFINWQAPLGTVVSLMPCGEVTGLTTDGLKWDLDNVDFNFGERDGTSNLTISDIFKVRIKSGNLIVYIHQWDGAIQ